MDEKTVEKNALLVKSIALIRKTINNLEQIDPESFPTKNTDSAKKLITDYLEKISQLENYKYISPHRLFKSILNIQTLVEDIRFSHVDHVSWQIVNHCDELWNSIFGKDKPQIFYSTINKHNYILSHFSYLFSIHLNKVLPLDEREEIKNKELYCLRLSSIENINLPLYANIAHEFGHVLYLKERNIISAFFQTCFINVFTKLIQKLNHKNISIAKRRIIKTISALKSISEEIFADLFAIFSFGPSYFLSLFEMSWGNDKNSWMVSISPILYEISAYPSTRFRLSIIKEKGSIEKFTQHENIKKITNECVNNAIILLNNISIDHNNDSVVVLPESDNDASIIESFLNENIDEIKNACLSFVNECWVLLESKYSHIANKVKEEDVYDLLKRFEYKILPNIIPDESLLGVPAKFENVLLASALHRISIIIKQTPYENLLKNIHELNITDRLTNKAFEVTFIQQKFNEFVE